MAKYSLNVSYATITLNAVRADNNTNLNNTSIYKGTSINISCLAGSELFFGLASQYPVPNGDPNGVRKAVDLGPHTNANDYNLSYSQVMNTIGSYEVQCTNIGKFEKVNFNVIENTDPTCPAGQVYKNGACRNTFDITGISSNPNKTNTANTFT